ncbi:hypothetical protein CCUS01_08179, partial [Colletotrichum cuscutae]
SFTALKAESACPPALGRPNSRPLNSSTSGFTTEGPHRRPTAVISKGQESTARSSCSPRGASVSVFLQLSAPCSYSLRPTDTKTVSTFFPLPRESCWNPIAQPSYLSPAVKRAKGYLRIPVSEDQRKEGNLEPPPYCAALLPTPPIFTPSRASTPSCDWSAGIPPASPNQSLDFIPPPCNPKNPDTTSYATLGERRAGKAPTPAIAAQRCTVFVDDHGPPHTDHILFVAHAQPLRPRYRPCDDPH